MTKTQHEALKEIARILDANFPGLLPRPEPQPKRPEPKRPEPTDSKGRPLKQGDFVQYFAFGDGPYTGVIEGFSGKRLRAYISSEFGPGSALVRNTTLLEPLTLQA